MLKFSKIQEIIPKNEISLLKNISDMGHEEIIFCSDSKTKLKAIIAVHSTELGPGLGGCRMWNYKSEDDALDDVVLLNTLTKLVRLNSEVQELLYVAI